MNMKIIEAEVKLLKLTADLTNDFMDAIQSDPLHPDESVEFRQLIHAIQDKISYRIAKKLLIKEGIFK